MSDLKPLKLWGCSGTNPPKVQILLKFLDLPHEIIDIPIPNTKDPTYVVINPNGRIPAIYDPNTDLTLWESGAIVEYLIERYDKSYKYSFPAGSNDAYLAKQWLFFQVSGQGPYYGQYVWFTRYHHEQLPTAIERYSKEINRVTSVLEGHLEKQKKEHGTSDPWLVGNKLSFADIVFIPWQNAAARILNKETGFAAEDYPNVKQWVDRMLAIPEVKAVSLPP